MKYTSTLFILFLSISLFGNVQPLSYSTEAPLIDHLISINKEWTKQKDVPTHLMTIPIKFNSDEERIQLHLQLVESTLKARYSDNLTIQQFANRKKNLESLVSYWKEGQFPINTRHSHRQPYFIDDFGTACAVGHLLLTSGEEDLAHHISDVQNYAYIHEMNYPELREWASENGFTKDELAWIQPSYLEHFCYDSEEVSGMPEYSSTNQPLSQQEIKTIMTLPDESMMIVGGSFLHYDSGNGIQTASVFGYDGNTYTSFGNAIQGTVYDIEYHNNLIYVAGDFVLAGTDFYNVAYWDGLQWIGVQTGDMGGAVRDIVSYECQLYAGGDFLSINGTDMANLAIWDGAAWSTTAKNCSGQTAMMALTSNGTVNTFEVHHEKLAIGGDFTSVSGSSPVEGLIFWHNQTLELLPPHGNISSVNHLETFQNALIIGAGNLYAYRWNKWYSPGDSLRYDVGYYSYGSSWTLPLMTGIHDIFYSPPTELWANNEFSNLIISANNQVHAINGKPAWYIASPFHSDYTITVDGTVSALGELDDTPFYGGNFNELTVDNLFNHSDGCEDFYVAEKIIGLTRTAYTYYFPIELTDFTVKSDDDKTAHLKWTSLTESNSLHYEVQRKTDNQDFTRIGIVNAAGESTAEINYTFEDNISTLKGEYVYYRLKMVDKDGSFEYSDIRSLKLRDFDPTVSVYPNPAEDVVAISLEMPWTSNLAVNIYNLKGQLINTYQWTYDTNLVVNEQIDISHLQTGLYLVEVVSPKERITKKLDIIK